MSIVQLPAYGWRPRKHQENLWRYLEGGGRNAAACWHRRAGKDDVALRWEAVSAHKRVGTYWHMLPEYSHARKAIWDAINPHSAKRRIDEAFPPEIRAVTRDHEMFIKFKNGSTWQVVGSDNFNSLIGSPPVGITYSEWAVADPRAHAFLRPILAENGGWALFIYTPRGYNHGYTTYEGARNNPKSFAEILTADQTLVIPADVLAEERRAYREEYGEYEGDALYRQEYECDFSAANIGAILGRYVEDADKQGRISDAIEYDPDGAPLEISADIGRRDAAAWWFWQPRVDGFAIVDYDEDSGLVADEWIERLKERIYRLDAKLKTIWLPHDAKAKTFAAMHSPVEQFLLGFGHDKVAIVPDSKREHRINAARKVMPRTYFNKTRCKKGLNGLRSWSYEYDSEKKVYSKEPRHDWASNPGDGYSYGCLIMQERIIVKPREIEAPRGLLVGANTVTLNEMWSQHERSLRRGARI